MLWHFEQIQTNGLKHNCSLRIWNWNEAKHVAYPAKGCQLPIIDSLLFVRFPGTVLLIDILFSDAPSVLMNSVFEEKKEKNIYFILESPCHQHNHHHHQQDQHHHLWSSDCILTLSLPLCLSHVRILFVAHPEEKGEKYHHFTAFKPMIQSTLEEHTKVLGTDRRK